jgi:PAS domain S-box-containing protein
MSKDKVVGIPISSALHRKATLAAAVIIVIILVITAFLVLAGPGWQPFPRPAGPGGPVTFSEEELSWIHDHPVITVCPDPEYPPFEFYDESGRYSGISADYMRLISEKTGLVITDTRRESFNACIELMQAQNYTILGAVFTSDLRKGYLNYTRTYYQPPLVILVRTAVTQPMTIKDLDGKTVVAIEGYTVHELLRQHYPGINLIVVPTIRDALRAVSLGNADAYIGEVSTTSWFVEKEGLTNLHIAGEYIPDDPTKFHLAIGVRNDEPELQGILNKGLAAITPEEKEAVADRWVTATLRPPGIDSRFLSAVIVGFCALVLVVVLTLMWNRSLTQAVGDKTMELSRELEERKKTEALLRESEEKYRTILETIQDVYYRCDTDGRLLMISPSGAKLLGYDSPGEMIGFDIARKVYRDPADREAFLDAMNTNGFVLDYEVCLKRKDGIFQLVSTTSHFYFDAQGEIAGIEGIFRDITQRKRAEEEMIRKNMELLAAYEQLTKTKDELRRNYEDLARSQNALEQARVKLSILNTVALQDIQNAVFTLSGYFELEKPMASDEKLRHFIDKQIAVVWGINESLQFIRNYQNLGLTPPRWQNVQQSFLMAISHRDFTRLSRDLRVKGLEIYADSLLEQVFFSLADNVLVHAKAATEIRLYWNETKEGLVIVFEDNGPGIDTPLKTKIFERQSQNKGRMGLYLAGQILSITGILIRECGEPGKGARFEIIVPRGSYRFVDRNGDLETRG